MFPFVLKLLFFNAFIYASGHAETIKAIVTKTANCFQCGMIEDVGQLDIKICGDLNCCFVQHLDNSEINFQAGTQDRFEGAGDLLQCYEFQVLTPSQVWKLYFDHQQNLIAD